MLRNGLMFGSTLLALTLVWGCPAPPETTRQEPAPADPVVASPDPAPEQPTPGETDPTPVPPTEVKTDEPPVLASPANSPNKSPANSPNTPPLNPSDSGQKDILFEGWPEPAAVLLLTGRQHGYIEPCGCTGLANQKGGLARRHTFQRELLAKGWKVASLDVGNQVRRTGKQAEIKFQFGAGALKTMNYGAVGLGPDDLRLSPLELFSLTNNEGQETPFTSANVSILAPEFMRDYAVLEAGGKKIGVVSVLGAEHLKKIQPGDIVAVSPEAGIDAVWPKVKAEECDLYVLLVFASVEESTALAQKYPQFGLVVTGGGEGEPERAPRRIEGADSSMVQVGTKGMYAGVIGIFDDKEQPLRYQRVPLDDRFADSKDMLSVLANYQRMLETQGLAGLGVRPLPHPSGHTYVGTQTCAECHTKAFDVWKNTPHAHATDSLIHPSERGDIPRHHDPECLSCHVTGWNPQQYFPYQSGYLGLKETPNMQANGCENCHGPGSAHVAAENGDGNPTAEDLAMLRAGMRLTLEDAKKNKCYECHDLDNSPDFHKQDAFDRYWKEVEHYGKD
ncbi:multiheme c-type cytochrome [Lignipirellula cremea]|uniref:Cytochrome c-554 n=1 Tax=Lignipirellula cremea TaxID=2528010 RepID=A0A518DS45_9BACT|nr:multiheme c-type cytochrome [Lignipirellula cremea]QDU94654.1 Cytochrome c-554 precursor [Lignipirellula cremea]